MERFVRIVEDDDGDGDFPPSRSSLVPVDDDDDVVVAVSIINDGRDSSSSSISFWVIIRSSVMVISDVCSCLCIVVLVSSLSPFLEMRIFKEGTQQDLINTIRYDRIGYDRGYDRIR